MVSLQTFIMSDSVEKEKIADMPDVSSGSIFPKTICSVELGQAARIGQNAFNACGQLHELTVPESVTSIGSNALGTGSRLVVSDVYKRQAEHRHSLWTPGGCRRQWLKAGIPAVHP